MLFKGLFGLEKEGFRILGDGSMSDTPHPFPGDENITMDFFENQIEIVTSPEPSALAAVTALAAHERRMLERLSELPEREYLWPFSAPPRIDDVNDVSIASFDGDLAHKTEYRRYLEKRYGKMKMTYSGIHFSFSFDDGLLWEEFVQSRPEMSQAASPDADDSAFRDFRTGFYLELAEKASAYAWLIVMLTAASPIVDRSFFILDGSTDERGEDVFTGKSSIRCSELGYWNAFTPVFDYSDLDSYMSSIKCYIDEGLLYSPSELYYPVRPKSPGDYSASAIREKGIEYIEFRVFDVNPLVDGGIDVRDIRFTQLLLIYLASRPRMELSADDQVMAMRNYKEAASFDLSHTTILEPNSPTSESSNITDAALDLLQSMKSFFSGLKEIGKDTPCEECPEWIDEVIDFQIDKVLHPGRRYCVQVCDRFSGSFFEKGLERAIELG
ncbi:MAG: hypothetical protein K5840_07170 [Eubacterium sp.]|nr:hypothetical protein [Eubacterium sp.]